MSNHRVIMPDLQAARNENAALFGMLSRIARNLSLEHKPAGLMERLDEWCSKEEEKRRTPADPIGL
mgnify:CR=1 FL=1